jgi:hypothetical protein
MLAMFNSNELDGIKELVGYYFVNENTFGIYSREGAVDGAE